MTCLSVSVVVYKLSHEVLLFLTYLLSSGTTVNGLPLLWDPVIGKANKLN